MITQDETSLVHMPSGPTSVYLHTLQQLLYVVYAGMPAEILKSTLPLGGICSQTFNKVCLHNGGCSVVLNVVSLHTQLRKECASDVLSQ